MTLSTSYINFVEIIFPTSNYAFLNGASVVEASKCSWIFAKLYRAVRTLCAPVYCSIWYSTHRVYSMGISGEWKVLGPTSALAGPRTYMRGPAKPDVGLRTFCLPNVFFYTSLCKISTDWILRLPRMAIYCSWCVLLIFHIYCQHHIFSVTIVYTSFRWCDLRSLWNLKFVKCVFVLNICFWNLFWDEWCCHG